MNFWRMSEIGNCSFVPSSQVREKLARAGRNDGPVLASDKGKICNAFKYSTSDSFLPNSPDCKVKSVINVRLQLNDPQHTKDRASLPCPFTNPRLTAWQVTIWWMIHNFVIISSSSPIDSFSSMCPRSSICVTLVRSSSASLEVLDCQSHKD